MRIKTCDGTTQHSFLVYCFHQQSTIPQNYNFNIFGKFNQLKIMSQADSTSNKASDYDFGDLPNEEIDVEVQLMVSPKILVFLWTLVSKKKDPFKLLDISYRNLNNKIWM